LDYFRQNFGDRVLLVAFVLLATSIAAVVAAVSRTPARPSDRVARVARVCSAGFVVAAIVATTSGIGAGQGFIWGIGDGGLRSWSSDLARFPDTIQSVLLVGNVAIYTPFGASVALGWQVDGMRPLSIALAVPAVVEGLQVVVLQGIGSTDDFILNAIGVGAGWLLARGGLMLVRRRRRLGPELG
jgi:hypothetical protein